MNEIANAKTFTIFQVYRGACMLVYEDSFIVMGGLSKKSEVLEFNHSTQEWTRLAPSPMQILNSGCVLLPDDKILVVGFFHAAYQKTAAIYDIKQVIEIILMRFCR